VTVVLKDFVMVSVAVRDAERSADENEKKMFSCTATIGDEFSIGHDKLLSKQKTSAGKPRSSKQKILRWDRQKIYYQPANYGNAHRMLWVERLNY
jgi:hypothetical protein